MQRITCSLKYQLRSVIIISLVTYGIFLGIGGILAIYPALRPVICSPAILSLPSLVLTIILGSRLFASNFNFLIANNITRRQFFATTLLTALSISALIAITNGTFLESLLPHYQNLKGIFRFLYGSGNPLLCTFWWFFLLTLFLLFSWFVTMLYQRANPFFRIVISLLPMLIANLLLHFDKLFTGSLRRAFSQGFDRFLALTKASPGLAIGNLFLANLLIILLVWLTLRRLTPQAKA